MLTRAGVAKRLGRSIATVRRMEGVELHPIRRGDGVHLFDPDEVDAAARGEAIDRRHRFSDLAVRGYVDDDGSDAADSEAETRVARLEAELLSLRKAHGAEMERLRQEGRERERRSADDCARATRVARVQAEKEAAATALGALLDSLSDRELARLGEDGLDELASLLDLEED